MASARFDEMIGSLRFALEASSPRTTEMPADSLARCEWYAVKLQIARSRTLDAVTEGERLQREYDALLAALRELVDACDRTPFYAQPHAAIPRARAAIAATEIKS